MLAKKPKSYHDGPRRIRSRLARRRGEPRQAERWATHRRIKRNPFAVGRAIYCTLYAERRAQNRALGFDERPFSWPPLVYWTLWRRRDQFDHRYFMTRRRLSAREWSRLELAWKTA